MLTTGNVIFITTARFVLEFPALPCLRLLLSHFLRFNAKSLPETLALHLMTHPRAGE